MILAIEVALKVDIGYYADVVKEADLAVQAAEVRDLMPQGEYGLESVVPVDDLIVPWPFTVARTAFLQYYATVRNCAPVDDQ